mgnify:CR=1 FL=1
MIIVHYEVYVLEGRGWMLHARYPRLERDSALAEARELEQTLKLKVRVVRETYYTDNNTFEEAEVYVTGGKAPPLNASSAGSPARPATGVKKEAAGKAPPARKAPRKLLSPRLLSRKPPTEEVARARQVLARLVAIMALGLAAALLVIKITPNVILMLWKMGFGIKLDAETYSRLLLVIFGLTFLMTAVPLAMRFLPRRAALPRFPGAGFGQSAKVTKPAAHKEMRKSHDKLAPQARHGTQAKDQEDGDDPPPMEFGLDDEKPRAEESAGRKDKDGKGESAQGADAHMAKVSRFLDGALEHCRSERVPMDNYNKFALHLYMAGAIEGLSEFRKLGGNARMKLMGNALETLGTRGEMATNFHQKLPEYRREPRYAAVIEAGRNAMGNDLLGDEMGAHMGLRDVFRDWNRKAETRQSQMMTVLFTDMVDSTNMTQIRGDAAAQEIVRRHNLIVRNALGKYGGHEVKHTGDGIMASFLSAANAIDAMMVVQRQVTEHNGRMPEQSLHLRIGLNAGEPIQEEDDLFGSTVQLAARVCAATGTDQILCTASVKDLSGKPASLFRSVGAKSVKGFREPIPMYEILWR